MVQIAERFAFLAERALAHDNPAQAQDYIAIGLQVDPDNATLLALRDLARPQRRGVVESLKSLLPDSG